MLEDPSSQPTTELLSITIGQGRDYVLLRSPGLYSEVPVFGVSQ